MIDHRISILLDGAVRRMDFEDVRSLVMTYEAKANDCLRGEGEYLARSGWLIMQMAGDRRYGVFEQIAARLSIHGNRVGRMRKYAERFIDPATGAFDELQWATAERTAAEIGKAGRATLSGIEVASGIRPTPRPDRQPNQTPQDRGFGSVYPNTIAPVQDPNQTLQDRGFGSGHPNTLNGAGFNELDTLDPDDDLAALASQYDVERPTAQPRLDTADRPLGCVGATQDMLPFHLAESGRRLADAAAALERRLDAGLVDSDAAMALQDRIDGLLADLINTAAPATGGRP